MYSRVLQCNVLNTDTEVASGSLEICINVLQSNALNRKVLNSKFRV